MADNIWTTFFSTDTLMVFRGVIPCLVVIFIGYVIGRIDQAAHEKTLSSLIFFVFSPCLVFSGIHRHAFKTAEISAIALAALLSLLLLLPLVYGVKRLNNATANSYMLPILFTSTGTLLMPLAYILYGNEGLAKAALFHLCSSFLFYTLGTRLAFGFMEPWRFFRNPTFYAAVIAVISKEFDIPLPDAVTGFFRLVERGIDIVGYGAIPILLLSFGYPFCLVEKKLLRRGFSGGAVRMLAGPVASFCIVLLIRQLGILSTAKGYNILDYIDMRTTEAVIILAGAIPGAVSCYLVNRRNTPDTAADSLAMLITASMIGVVTIPFTLIMINRFILAG